MPDYVLTYDIPNEHREKLEYVLTNGLKATREMGVSTFWRFKSKFPASEICEVLKAHFPALKMYVYEVIPTNSATTEVSKGAYEELRALLGLK